MMVKLTIFLLIIAECWWEPCLWQICGTASKGCFVVDV